MSIFQRLPLSRKILLGIVPLFLVFVSISVLLQNHFQEQEMMEQAQVAAQTYADIIKESLVTMMVNDSKVDESFLVRVNDIQQFDTAHILINDLKLRDQFLTPERLQRLETRYKKVKPDDEIEVGVLRTGKPIFSRYGQRFRAVIPFNASSVCQKCHAVPIGYTLGATDLWVSFEKVSKAAEENWRRSLIIFIAFTVLALAVASLMFARVVAQPIERLVAATTEISRGNLEYTIPSAQQAGIAAAGKGHSRDELAFLARKFDDMRVSLKEKIGQLDQVNRSLSERNKEVEQALTRLRLAQEQLVQSERLAVTGKMTAQLSHEINNPIHNIQSLLESSLRKMNGSVQAKELVTVALEEVTRMAKLTRQMLDFYRVSVVRFEKEDVNLKEMFVELVKTNEEPLAKQKIEIVLETPLELPNIHGSRDKLKQVFLNLILNARDAMPDGGRITIRPYVRHGYVRVDVSDTGVGIPQEHLGKIFDAFFTTKKEVSGVGLGLSVSYGIVQQHEGTIEVTSIEGTGTTFTVQLPTAGETNG